MDKANENNSIPSSSLGDNSNTNQLSKGLTKELANNSTELANDCISRQAAIDALIALTVYSKKREIVKEADNHPNTWIEGVVECIDEIEDLPSTHPEIIRCKDCKHWRGHKYVKETKRYIPFCGFNAIYTEADDFCSRAERREE